MKFKIKNPFNKDKDSKKDRNKNITTPEVDVIIKRLQGDTPVGIATFKAFQTNDKDFNLRLVNEEFDFKDDLEVIKHKLIDLMNYKYIGTQ